MSTSVGEFDSRDDDVGNRTSHIRKPSIRGVKKLMNRIVGSNKVKRAKQTENEGLVKGGLTPTLRRRENGAESGPSNDGNYGHRSDARDQSTTDGYVDSASRLLMTRSNLQVALPKWDKTPGTLGIYNHGNTCFMNTVLQCLSNTDDCAEYFVLRRFKEILHVKGIAKRLVGTLKVDITEHLSQLLESLWSLNYNPALSDHFKSVVSKYNSQYKGSSQHDAQEFLLWLLDRLNEELHHSQKKKSKDSNSKLKKQNELPAESSPEAVLSTAQGFEIYNKFQALYQSSLVCPNCGKQSDTYESYLCLSLPVPQRCLRPVYITVVYLDDDPKQLRIALEMNMFEMVKDLREKLAFELDVTTKRLVLCQVGEDGFRNTFGDEQPLSDIHENENVYAFETFPLRDANDADSSYEVIQILLVNIERYSSTKSYRICSPQVIRVPRDEDYKYIQKQILKSLGLAVPDDVICRADEYPVLFKIHVVDSGAKDCYLPTDVEMPLYTEAIDRAINTYNEGFGPKHVKFIVEWDPKIKERIIVNDDEQLEEHHSVHKVRLNQQQPSHVSLDECLKLFTKEERLSDEDAWSCPFCQKEQRGATKKLGLWSCPDILVIHLKRFRQTALRRNKLNILVNFPVTGLDMGRHIVQKEGSSNRTSQAGADMYDLYGVTNHYGNMNGGHYTAFCKNPIDFHWYEFDDTHVKPINNRDIVSRAAYLLFYQRRQVTNTSRTALQDGTHWIYTLYERPSVDNTSSAESTERDYDDSVDSRIRTDKSGSYLKDQRSIEVNGKSKSGERDYYLDRSREYNELHREVNTPRQDVESLSSNINSPRQVINSPRQERSYRSSPEKEFRNDRHTSDDLNNAKSINSEPLRVNLDKTKSSAAQNVVENGLDFREKYYVEKINIPRSEVNINDQQSYRRSFSEDSYKNAINNSFTSSIEEGLRYNPLSPTELVKSNPPSPGTLDSAGSYEKKALLNNERNVNTQSGLSSDFKKFHQNELDRQGATLKSVKSEQVERPNIPKHFNQIKSSNKSKPDSNTTKIVRADVYATPQQTRKPPSPPVQNARGPWLTPQPQRKSQNTSETRPVMERQSSVPVHKAHPTSSYFEHQLESHKQGMLDSQPHSLPIEINFTTEKPPLPRPSTASRVPAKQKSQEGSRSVSASYDGSNKERLAENGLRADLEGRTPRAERRSYENEAVRKVSERDQMERTRSVERDKSLDYRRSMRVKNERPLSYHQTTDKNLYDLEDQRRFERSSKYATLRTPAPAVPINDEGRQYLPRQYVDPQYSSNTIQIHQPRSRAPIPYNPYRYQEPELNIPRYQPQFHSAKFMSKLALQEKEYINKKMKSQFLKESSV